MHGEVIWTKGSKPQVAGSNPVMGYIFFHILYRKLYKNLPIFGKILDFESNFFLWYPLIKSSELTGSGFESQHKLSFLPFCTKNFTFFMENCTKNYLPKKFRLWIQLSFLEFCAKIQIKEIFFQASKSTPCYEYFEPYRRHRLCHSRSVFLCGCCSESTHSRGLPSIFAPLLVLSAPM